MTWLPDDPAAERQERRDEDEAYDQRVFGVLPTQPALAAALELDAPAMTAGDVKEALRRRHPAPAWVCCDEAFSGFAMGGGGIDMLAVGVWRTARVPGLPGAGHYNGHASRDARNAIVGYEVKVTRADFRRELYGYEPGPTVRRPRPRPPWPVKQFYALQVVHYFVFAVPAGLLHDDEIDRREPWVAGLEPRRGALYLPVGVGLVEVDGRGCRVRADAQRRSPRPWTRHEFAELLRRVEYTAIARTRREH